MKLTIEWLHVEKEGKTCIRCAETGQTLQQVLTELARECGPRGVTVRYRERTIPPTQLGLSNLVLINGIPIEKLLPNATSSTSRCASCCELSGVEAQCRTVESQGQTFEALPASMIRQAVCAVAGCC